MSSSNVPDPRLLLPEWLRDDAIPTAPAMKGPNGTPVILAESALDEGNLVEIPTVTEPALPNQIPFSDRLSLDTRLDPALLVAATDLPKWLGGTASAGLPGDVRSAQPPAATLPAAGTFAIEEPEPYEGAGAPEPGVTDVQLNGWYLVAGAIALLVLLIGAFKLYLS